MQYWKGSGSGLKVTITCYPAPETLQSATKLVTPAEKTASSGHGAAQLSHGEDNALGEQEVGNPGPHNSDRAAMIVPNAKAGCSKRLPLELKFTKTQPKAIRPVLAEVIAA